MSASNETKALSGCLVVIAVLLLSVAALPVEGWAVATLWRWFAVPTFGVAPITIWFGTGLATLACALRPFYANERETPPHSTLLERAVINGFVNPILLVAFGWIIRVLGGLQ